MIDQKAFVAYSYTNRRMNRNEIQSIGIEFLMVGFLFFVAMYYAKGSSIAQGLFFTYCVVEFLSISFLGNIIKKLLNKDEYTKIAYSFTDENKFYDFIKSVSKLFSVVDSSKTFNFLVYIVEGLVIGSLVYFGLHTEAIILSLIYIYETNIKLVTRKNINAYIDNNNLRELV